MFSEHSVRAKRKYSVDITHYLPIIQKNDMIMRSNIILLYTIKNITFLVNIFGINISIKSFTSMCLHTKIYRKLYFNQLLNDI